MLKTPTANPIPPTQNSARRWFFRCWSVVVFFVTFFVTVILVRYGLESVGWPRSTIGLGATFSVPYAQQLGIDWREAYEAVLDDLGVKRLRLPAYWNMIEPEKGEMDFTGLDWQISEAEKRNVQVILAVGRKLPRWPECHVPKWATEISEGEQQAILLKNIETIVRRYADSTSVIAWQVENEPFFSFGVCPPPNREFLEQEIALVHSLDSRPVVVTESGELSTWIRAASVTDILGLSVYRVVWNDFIGYFHWPITPSSYRDRWLAVSPLAEGAFISELQGEPWSAGRIEEMSLVEQEKRMSPARLRSNVDYARRTGFAEAYLWGVEWWYWAKQNGYPEIWDEGRRLFQVNAFASPRNIWHKAE